MKRGLSMGMRPPLLDPGQAQGTAQPAIGGSRQRRAVIADYDSRVAVETKRDLEDAVVAVESRAQVDVQVSIEQPDRPPRADGMHRRVPTGHVAEECRAHQPERVVL